MKHTSFRHVSKLLWKHYKHQDETDSCN